MSILGVLDAPHRLDRLWWIHLEDGLTMASPDKGLFPDFIRYEKDAHGLILVIFTHKMVRR
jgi:hypothetical protein